MKIQAKIKNLITEFGIIDDKIALGANSKTILDKFNIILLNKMDIGFTTNPDWIKFLEINNDFKYIIIAKGKLPSAWYKQITYWQSDFCARSITGLMDYVVFFPSKFAPLFIAHYEDNQELYIAIAPFDLGIEYTLDKAIPKNFDSVDDSAEYTKGIDELWLLSIRNTELDTKPIFGFYQDTKKMLKMRQILKDKGAKVEIETIKSNSVYVDQDKVLG